jgi:hypothetical protein
MLITLIGLVIADAFRTAYDLSGVPLIAVVCFVLLGVFIAGDLAEDWLIAYFNRGEKA